MTTLQSFQQTKLYTFSKRSTTHYKNYIKLKTFTNFSIINKTSPKFTRIFKTNYTQLLNTLLHNSTQALQYFLQHITILYAALHNKDSTQLSKTLRNSTKLHNTSAQLYKTFHNFYKTIENSWQFDRIIQNCLRVCKKKNLTKLLNKYKTWQTSTQTFTTFLHNATP